MPSTTSTAARPVDNGVNGTAHHLATAGAGASHHDELLQDASYQATIASERAKTCISFREELAPGLTIEMELKAIHVMTQSKFQKIEVLETCFGKVCSSRSCLVLLLLLRNDACMKRWI